MDKVFFRKGWFLKKREFSQWSHESSSNLHVLCVFVHEVLQLTSDPIAHAGMIQSQDTVYVPFDINPLYLKKTDYGKHFYTCWSY